MDPHNPKYYKINQISTLLEKICNEADLFTAFFVDLQTEEFQENNPMEFEIIYPAVHTCRRIMVENHPITKLSNTIKYEKAKDFKYGIKSIATIKG